MHLNLHVWPFDTKKREEKPASATCDPPWSGAKRGTQKWRGSRNNSWLITMILAPQNLVEHEHTHTQGAGARSNSTLTHSHHSHILTHTQLILTHIDHHALCSTQILWSTNHSYFVLHKNLWSTNHSYFENPNWLIKFAIFPFSKRGFRAVIIIQNRKSVIIWRLNNINANCPL